MSVDLKTVNYIQVKYQNIKDIHNYYYNNYNVRLNGDKKYLFDDTSTLSSVIYRKSMQIYYYV